MKIELFSTQYQVKSAKNKSLGQHVGKDHIVIEIGKYPFPICSWFDT